MAAPGPDAQGGAGGDTPGKDMAALHNFQSMDWLFKKERIFLLAQFWQQVMGLQVVYPGHHYNHHLNHLYHQRRFQRATLAENEVHTLKEQLETVKCQKGFKESNNNNNNNNNNINSTNSNHNNINNGTATSTTCSTTTTTTTTTTEAGNDLVDSSEVSDRPDRTGRNTPIEDMIQSKEKEVRGASSSSSTSSLKLLEAAEVSKLVEDISRLQAALSGVKEATAAQMHAMEEQLEQKNRLIQRLEFKLEHSSLEEAKRDLHWDQTSNLWARFRHHTLSTADTANWWSEFSHCEAPPSTFGPRTNIRDGRLGPEGLSMPPRSLETLLADRSKAEHDLKIPASEFGKQFHDVYGPLPPMSHAHLHPPLRPHLPPPLAPPPMASPLQPLAPHPPPGTPLHHLLGEEWRRSLERSAQERHHLTSGQMSPDSGGVQMERSDSRDSPLGDINMKSPSSLVNGFPHETKSPFQSRDDRSPFKEEIPSLAFKFEDRITGESLIPKGDPMEARLQEILRFNMEKFCQQNLDTLTLARRVRELLSIHNIGQRLFAKYVLGLSQGTVSELLSKPKCWDKLTEKGRDSYRKMHAWATDDNAVFLLKSLIPKKGLLTGSKEAGGGYRGPDDTVTEERIQHILSEASRAMTSTSVPNQPGQQDQDSRSTDSKSPASSTHSPSSPLSRDSRPRLRKFDNDDMPQEKVARIYQEELVKLMSRPQEPPLPLPRDPQYPGILFPFLGQSLLFNRSPEEVKLALDAYHQELSKLQGGTGMGLGAAGLGMGGAGGLGVGVGGSLGMGVGLGAGGLHSGAQDLSLPKREPQRNMDDEDEGRNMSVASPFGHSRSKAETSLSTSTPLGNLVTPITSIAVSSAGEDMSVSASPLQRMASITNSLMTGPAISTSNPVPQKPLKAVLPPITQQQFDQYSSMNTEEIVKKVKEQLSQYSISQRLFGESVLGLSQGSVSDLLARPKPWHMLTQKGREPFIRMKIFLEDDNAVHKLVASQYKIAPEKLMRTGGYTAPPLYLVGGCPLPGGLAPPGSRLPGGLSTTGSPTLPPYTSSSKPQHHLKLPADLPKSMESPLPPVGIPPSLGGLPLPTHHMSFDARMPLLDPLRKAGMGGVRAPGPVAPSVYEMAALTQDLDTQVITTKIKEALLANNIGQKLFGEAVLGLSQGSVSELLSKPKPWHMLSIKGREPFIRMQLWLNDSRNLEKLQQLKNERREANKRRRALDPTVEVSQDSQDVFQAPSPGGSSKKQRVLFSEEQKEALRLAFALDPYPNLATIEFLAQELQLSTRTITNWFHNHRMRLKQNPNSPGDSSPSRDPQQPPPGQPQGQSFDPLHFRLLLSQRLMELRKEKGLPPTMPGLGPGLHPGLFPHFPHLGPHGLGSQPLDRDISGGLDLSMKPENDYDDSSLVDEDSNMSGAMSPSGGGRSEGEGDDRDGRGAPSPVSRSSRRKPAAPQWVNPSWASGEGGKEREVIINGVCVMQTDDYRLREQETVRIEPTPVDEARARSLKEEGEDETEEEQQQLPVSTVSSSPCPDTMETDPATLQEEDPSTVQEEPTPNQETIKQEAEVEEDEEA
ncbi:homeobox protein cut isoform X4 [Procambarus clarkii]|uniref:homeobox protein cut isoform X4 n=1 Tax=Procambarus clarkii TaxID=6728 RepID=UPI0037438A8B